MNRNQTRPLSGDPVHTRAAKGGLISGAGFALNLGLNLLQIPLLLRFWPQETYGLWLSVGALSSVLTTLDGGHQAYVGNLLSRQYVEDRAQFRRTLASAVRMAGVTSTVQILLTLALCLTGWAAGWLGIAVKDAAEFSLAAAIYTVGWISTGSVGAVLVRLLPPAGMFVRSTWWAIGTRIVQFGAVVVAAWFGWGLVGTTLLFTGAVFLYNLTLLADIRRLFPDLFPWWRGGDIRVGFANFARSSVLTFTSILDLVSLQGVVLLVTSSLGAAAVPLFTTLRTLANTAMQGTGFLLNPIAPDLVRYHVQREGRKITAVFGFFWLTTGAVINGGVVAGLFFVEPVYRFWTSGRLAFDRALFAWLAGTVLVRTLAAPFQSYLSGINHLTALTVTAVARAGLTISCLLLLAPRFGLAGVGAGLFIAEAAGALVLPAWYAGRSLTGLGGSLQWGTLAWAGLSTCAALATLAAFARSYAAWPVVAVLAALLVVAIAWLQWRDLPPDVRVRARAVATPVRRWLGLRPDPV